MVDTQPVPVPAQDEHLHPGHEVAVVCTAAAFWGTQSVIRASVKGVTHTMRPDTRVARPKPLQATTR